MEPYVIPTVPFFVQYRIPSDRSHGNKENIPPHVKIDHEEERSRHRATRRRRSGNATTRLGVVKSRVVGRQSASSRIASGSEGPTGINVDNESNDEVVRENPERPPADASADSQ